MLNEESLNVKEIKSIFTTIEEFRDSIYRFSSPEFKSNLDLLNENRKGCGAKRFGLTGKRKLRIINRVRSDENRVK